MGSGESGAIHRRPVGHRAGVDYPALLVFAAVILGLALRTLGLGWGLPQPSREYPYHPDEPVLAVAALQVDFGALQLSPRFFHYGSLSIYLDRLAVNAASRAGWINLKPRTREEVAQLLGGVILVGRRLTVLMGVLTVVATAALGARLFGPRAGALAALLLALAPLHLAQGHYFTVDVPATLWTTLSLLLCAAALRRPDRSMLALAGACAGLAASTKYNAGVVLLAPLYTLAVTWQREAWYASDRAAALIYTPLAAAAAFLLTTPGIVIDSHTFWADFGDELHHAATGHGLVFVNTPPAWLFHLTRSLPDGLGLPLAVLAVAGVVWAVGRHTPEDGLLLVFTVSYYLLIGGAEIKFARYLVPVLPALVILAARVLTGEEWKRRGDGETGRRRDGETERGGMSDLPAPRPPVFGVLRATVSIIVLLSTGAYGVAMAEVFAREDPRDQAAHWIEERRGPEERIGLAGEPWFYTPPLTPALGCTHQMEGACGEPVPGWILAPGAGQGALSLAALSRERPKYVLASEFEYADSLRLQREIGYTDGTTALMAALARRYRLVRTCRNRPSLGPLHWFESRPPVHDLLYPMPDVRIYERR
jgi:4-amino-4-deoxy-L-arabinose transferase-like glycosyltransferase